jgi:uncharacterized protein
MNLLRHVTISLLLGGTMLAGATARAADVASFPPKKVLFFSKSSGYEHDAIKLKMKDGRRGYAFPVLEEIGRQNNIAFTFSKDGSLFSLEYLAQFDAIMFYTTGDLTLAKNSPTQGDGNPPMTAAGKQALLDAIANGKGFIGTHSATDTFHSPGGKDHGPARFQNDGDKTDVYAQLIGAEFIRHGKQQPGHLIVVDPKFPGTAAVPADFCPLEEWYSLKDFSADLHVTLVNDTAGMTGPEYDRAPYPETWARLHGKGRVFYTSMGHREDVWNNPVFQSVLAGGINWALGRVNANVTPNLASATPSANLLPKYVPPPPKKATPAAASSSE